MKIEAIEGIGPAYGERLRNAGIDSIEKLLKNGSSKKQRIALAEKSGIDESKLLRWVNLCDLCRIKGVSSQYSELLEAAGVDTVKELRNRNADNLFVKMREINKAKNLVRCVPSEANVKKWIEQAKTMTPMVSH